MSQYKFTNLQNSLDLSKNRRGILAKNFTVRRENSRVYKNETFGWDGPGACNIFKEDILALRLTNGR